MSRLGGAVKDGDGGVESVITHNQTHGNRSHSCPVPQCLVMRIKPCFSNYLTLFPHPSFVISPFFFNPIQPSSSSFIHEAFVTSHVFFFPAVTDTGLFIRPLPNPPSSLHRPNVLKPTDQTKSPHKYQPSSANQPNCSRAPCLGGEGFPLLGNIT